MFVIAGVTGHVGGEAARQLLAANQKVRVIVRSAVKGTEWSTRGAEVAVGKLDDASFVAEALKGATGFFTLLPPDFAAPNFYASQQQSANAIASGVKTSGVPLVVMLSSLGADLAEGTGPIKGLHYLENALRATGTKVVAIRAAYFMENVGQSLGAAKTAGIFPNFMAARDVVMPTIATKDIGSLVAKSLMSPPAKSEVLDLIGPMHTVNQIVETLSTALSKPLQIIDIPPQGHVDAMVKAGLPRPLAEAYAEMYVAFNTGKVSPQGDRVVPGTTTLEAVVRSLVG